MKILEHGSYFGVFVVKCPFCGCVFEVNAPDELLFSEPVYVNSNALTFAKINCPECEAHIDFDENKIEDVTEM
jgi:phage FluMu protein Com